MAKLATITKDKYSTDPGFRRGRNITIVIVMGLFSILIWFGRDMIIAPEPRTVMLYCFTGMQEVVEDGIIPAFKDNWQAETGEKLEIVTTFAGSGAIVDKIISRFPAEVAILASPIDAVSLGQQIGAPAKAGKDLPYHGVIASTPIVMITRDGNPKGITDFDDLMGPTVDVLIPDPQTSGDGQWGLLAIYGSIAREVNDPDYALQQTAKVWGKVVSPKSNMRESLQQFQGGVGDVLLIYEAIVAGNETREPIEGWVVYPASTILCTHIATSIQKNIVPKQQELIDSFIQYLWSEEAQEIFANYGLYTAQETSDQPVPRPGVLLDIFNLDDLGGARQIRMDVIGKIIHLAAIETLTR
ncbi:substrate-binding domain-containing protein [Candidatus Neomarinimicrobiota bacterium]